MKRTVYLVRHGQSEANIDPKLYYKMKDHEIPITPLGIEQAKKVGKELDEIIANRFSVALISSPYLRAKKTEEHIYNAIHFNKEKQSERYILRQESPLLAERIWGEKLHTLFLKNETKQDTQFDFFYIPKYGESYLDCYMRVCMFFNLLEKTLKHTDIHTAVIVTHGEWMRMADMFFKGTTVQEYNEQDMFDNHPKNCEIREYTLMC